MTDYLNNSNKTTFLFKKFQNKAQAGIDFTTNETGGTSFLREQKESLNNIYNTDIFIENIERNLSDEYKLSSLDACGNIPGSIWNTTISVQDCSNSSFSIPNTNLIFYKEIYLNPVSGTNNAWWLIPSDYTNQITNNNLLKDMIPFNFNPTSLFTFSPIVKYWNGSEWRTQSQNNTSGLNWLIDYASGILQFYQNDSILNGLNIDCNSSDEKKRPRISFIKYVGKKGLENFSGGGGGSSTIDISGNISTLTDTNITTPITNGSSLVYNTSSGKWENNLLVDIDTLNNLSDTNISSVANKDFLLYDTTSSKWINTPSNIENLKNVSLLLTADREILQYNAVNGNWENNILNLNTIQDVNISSLQDGEVLRYNSTSSKWENQNNTDTTYTEGTGVSISPSNEISIGQSVGTIDNVTFNQLLVSNAVLIGTALAVGTDLEVVGTSNLCGQTTIDNVLFDQRTDSVISGTTYNIHSSIDNTKNLLLGFQDTTGLKKYWKTISGYAREQIDLVTYNESVGLPTSATLIRISNTGTASTDVINYVAQGNHNFYENDYAKNGIINTARINLKDYAIDSTEYCSIRSSIFNANGGQLEFHVKDNNGSLEERMTINKNNVTISNNTGKFILNSNTYDTNTGPRIKFSILDPGVPADNQSVRIRHNIFDVSSPAGSNTPFGLIIEKDSDNTQSGNAYLQVEGRIYTGSTHLTSDDRIKSYETELTDATNVLKSLRPLKYEKHPGLMLDEDHEDPDLTNVEHYTEVGFIAQELEKITELSFMVLQDPSKELKTVGMTNLIGYLVKGFQELETRVSALENK